MPELKQKRRDWKVLCCHHHPVDHPNYPSWLEYPAQVSLLILKNEAGDLAGIENVWEHGAWYVTCNWSLVSEVFGVKASCWQ